MLSAVTPAPRACRRWLRRLAALGLLACSAAAPAGVIHGDTPSITVVCQRHRWCSLPAAPAGDWYVAAPQAGGNDSLEAWSQWQVDGANFMLRAETKARSVDVLLRLASGRTRLLRLIPVEPRSGPPVPDPAAAAEAVAPAR